jgi:hypothetical protein
MSKPKKVSAKEKIEIFEAFFQRLHFHRYVSMKQGKIHEMLELADNLVNAQARYDGTGLLSDDVIQERINTALDKMRTLP